MEGGAGIPFIDSIVHGDAVAVMRELPEESVDLVFADPPYNLQLRNELYRPDQSRVEGVDESWDRFSSFQEYDDFTYRWLAECRRVMKRSASIWVIGTYHNIFRIGRIMQDMGFWIINDVVWIKNNPMPNFRGVRFTNAHETLIFAARDRSSRYRFHYKSMRAYNDGVQMRSDWYIPICSGKERIRNGHSRVHATQKPEELLRRIILSSSDPGDTLLDPFAGTGTACAVSRMLGRHFIGIEREERYVLTARERVAGTVQLDAALLSYPMEEKKPRVPFGSLVSSGMIREGETLYSEDGRFKATVLANATVVSGNVAGSIHSVSAALLGKPRYNGWSFWYVKRHGTLKSIDELRRSYMEISNGNPISRSSDGE